ncbi:MAG: hypothetical protein Q4E13_12310 [Clostridia bacterium]|nr:hypothetical protein [Clostridia bacterium]
MVNMVFEKIEPETKVFHFGGADVTAQKRIPYKKVLECAAFIATRVCYEDPNHKGLAIRAVDERVAKMQGLLLYFTDANVEGMGKDSLYKMYDALCEDEEYELFRRFIGTCSQAVFVAMEDMISTMTDRIEYDTNRFDWQKLMGAFLNDPDPEATIARNREINERLIDMLKPTKGNGGIPKGALEDLPVSFDKR